MACETPDAHPAVESWNPGSGVHVTTRRDCCWPDPFPADGAPYPARPGPADNPDD